MCGQGVPCLLTPKLQWLPQERETNEKHVRAVHLLSLPKPWEEALGRAIADWSEEDDVAIPGGVGRWKLHLKKEVQAMLIDF